MKTGLKQVCANEKKTMIGCYKINIFCAFSWLKQRINERVGSSANVFLAYFFR